MASEDPYDLMWFRALSMLDRAVHVRRGFSRLREGQRVRPTWMPSVDMFEVEQILWIALALPGVSPNSVEVMVKSGTLVVTGERRLPTELRRAVVHRMEIPHGQFERCLTLPPGQYELGEHKIIDGCLILRLNKSI